MDPVRKQAALLVERLDLTPPVDIRALVERFADLEYCDWPFDCDGIAEFSGPQPRVFIKTGQRHRRERFTLAHELGHVVIPWHVSAVDCKPESGGNGANHERYLGVHPEPEANRFAAHVLLPDRYIARYRQRYVHAPDVLKDIEVADMSAAAGLLGVCRVLLPGYVFYTPALKRPAYSEGTASCRIGELRDSAVASGVVMHQGQQVEWYQTAEDVPRPTDLRSKQEATEVLREIEASSAWPDHKGNFLSKVNGVVGSVRSRHASPNPEAMLGVLLYKCASHSDLAPLTGREDFRDYLSFRATELAQRAARKES